MNKSAVNHSNVEVFQLQAEMCKSLSDPKRLCIIHELLDGEKSVSELAERLGLKQSNTSQHIGVLRKQGIIVPRREQSTVYYSLVNPKIAEACNLVREVIMEQLRHRQHMAGIT
jgi:ArsR family transcriptional regulator